MAARTRTTALLLALMLSLQLLFWSQTKAREPVMEIVPPAPGKASVEALSLGDNEFYFRVLALEMQNFGDTFGRFTSFRFYDFSRLYQWFVLLDSLDAHSNLLPMLAANYFSQTQNTPDVRYMADYLYEHSVRDVPHSWWWLLQGIYLSMYKLNDQDLAAKFADKMVNPEVPPWAQEMAAVVHEKRGEMDEALHIMETIRDHAKSLSRDDLYYMNYFVKERLHRLEELAPMAPETPAAPPKRP